MNKSKAKGNKSGSLFHLVTLLLGIVFGIIIFIRASQEENLITGRVFPAGLDTPMRECVVKIEGKPDTLYITKDDGKFELKVDGFPIVLEFSKPTYKTELVKVKKASDISVYLSPK